MNLCSGFASSAKQSYKSRSLEIIEKLKHSHNSLRDWKIDNSWIFLNKETVLFKSIVSENQIFRQSNQFKALDEIVIVGLVLFACVSIVLGKKIAQWNLRNDVLKKFVSVKRRGW